MSESRRMLSREFKIEATKQVVGPARELTIVARGLGVKSSMLSRWRTEFDASAASAFSGNGRLNPAEAETRRLWRDLATAPQGRDILEGAGIFFAMARK